MLGEIMAGNGSEVRDRRLPDRAAHQGRDRRGDRRPRRGDARARHPGRHAARRPARHRRHRRWTADVQRVDHRRAGRRRRRLRGGQARQPLRHGPVAARPTCWRRSARASTSTPARRRRAASTRSASASCSRPPTTRPRARSSRCARSSRSRTIFNFLGPLTNPAGARRQVVGVSDPAYLEVMAGALARLGCDRALVVSSADGLDEMSTSAPTHVVEVNGDDVRRLRRRPRRCGPGAPRPQSAISGGDPQANAATTRAVFDGRAGA